MVFLFAQLAQLGERSFRKGEVAGSIPVSSIRGGSHACVEWSLTAPMIVGLTPPFREAVAQRIEQLSVTELVTGSNPVGLASLPTSGSSLTGKALGCQPGVAGSKPVSRLYSHSRSWLSG